MNPRLPFDPNAVELPPYRPPWGLRGAHAQTIAPALARRVRGLAYRRERIETPDGDFLDLDWADASGPADGRHRVVVVTHGLEGDAGRSYMRGMARAFARRGWDALAWNLRGCSGEPNRLARTYHSGATDDMDAVVHHALGLGYARLGLVGFSLGGNLTLKWLGERGEGVDPRVVGAATFSVPVDLASSAEKLAARSNRVYMRYFLRRLGRKVRDKHALFPDALDLTGLRRMRSFQAFDARYTAPLNGFASAEAYWRESSSRPFLPHIRVPTLLVNAADDPFLTPDCFPHAEAAANPFFRLLVTERGGHVGFATRGPGRRWADEFWSETVATRFLTAALDAAEATRAA